MYSRSQHSVAVWNWEDFDIMCTTKNRSVSKVNADGLCLLNAFRSCLLHDFGEIISISAVKEKITSFLCDNAEQYNMSDSTQKVQMLYWKMFRSSLKQKSMLHQISVTC